MLQETSPGRPSHEAAPAAAPPFARLAVSVLFFVNGAVFASWATNIPVVQRALHLEPGPLGLVLLAVPAGAVLGMPLAGWLAPTLGGGRIAAVLALLFCATLPLLRWPPTQPCWASPSASSGPPGGPTT